MNANSLKLSVVDLSPVLSGASSGASFANSLALAQHVERLGYERYWFAEHHNMRGIASSSPEVLIAHIAQGTERIRVGSGGIMLPNHASLRIAEAFRTLEALHPGRIDLGLGRAPGSGSAATLALRGAGGGRRGDEFPQQLDELIGYLSDGQLGEAPPVGLIAMPNGVAMPELWILGSSDFGAHLAGLVGLPYAFAQHFSSLPAKAVLDFYRRSFKPSSFLSAPRAIMASHVVCADTDEQAKDLALSSDLSFHLFHQTGNSMPLPTVAEAKAYPFTAADWARVRATSMPKFIGSPATLRETFVPFVESMGIDELMVLTMVHDQAARRHSYQLVSELFGTIKRAGHQAQL